MKHNSLTNLFFIVVIFIPFLVSCNERPSDEILLDRALLVADQNPNLSFRIIDSILNPEKMRKDKYMQFVLTKAQVKYDCGKNIACDTFLTEAVSYFKQNNEQQKLLHSYYYTANMFWQQKKETEAFEYFHKTTDLAKNLNNRNLEAESLFNIGYLYYTNNEFDSATSYFQKALHRYQEAQYSDTTCILNTMYRLAINYCINKEQAHFEQAVQEILSLSQNSNDTLYYVKGLNASAGINRSLKNYSAATKDLHKALGSSININDSVISLLALSEVLEDQHSKDSAKYYDKLMLHLVDKMKYDRKLLSVFYTNFIEHYIINDDKSKAKFYKEQKVKLDSLIDMEQKQQDLLEYRKEQMFKYRDKQIGHIVFFTSLTFGLIFIVIWSTYKVNVIRKENKKKNKVQQQPVEEESIDE